MKVKDLIERLKRLDPDAMVLIPYENKVGAYVETECVVQTKAKSHSELDDIYVYKPYYKEYPTKNVTYKVVTID